MFKTLFSKTFIILSVQFILTWAATVFIINLFQRLYYQGKLGITATKNKAGELDLELNFSIIRPYVAILFAIDIAVFLMLLFFGKNNLIIGIPLFCIWSISTGIVIALSLLSVDENLGKRVLAITACITAITAIIGMRSGISFAFMGKFLYVSLVVVLLANITRIFIKIQGVTQKIIAAFGCITFTGYLVFDFNILAEQSKNGINNTWQVAMDTAINIYLDVINLFLNLLDLLSN